MNKNPTCYKNPNNPSNTDLILIAQKAFFKIDTIFTGLFDFFFTRFDTPSCGFYSKMYLLERG